MSQVIGPFPMFDFDAGTGPFVSQLINAASRGGRHIVVGPFVDADGNELYSQHLPEDIVRNATWNSYETWLSADPLNDLNFTRVYVQLTETQYTDDDVPVELPNSTLYDEEGAVVRQKKWNEWRASNQTHWKSLSTGAIAVPSTAMGAYIPLRAWIAVETAYPGKTRSQKQWDNVVGGLPEGDVIPWPETL